MSFTSLEYLLAVSEERSFSKAAQRCYVSQPALTRSVKTLENSLGVQLFDRSKTPISLTKAGERYVEGAKKIMRLKRELDAEMAGIAAKLQEKLVLGITITKAPTWLPRILSPFWKACPNTEVNVLDGTSAQLERMLLEEKIDFVLMNTLSSRLPEITHIPLLEEQIVFVLSREMHIFDGIELPPPGPLTLQYIPAALLDGQPFVSPDRGHGIYHAARAIFERHGIEPQTIIEMTNSSATRHVASSGAGFSIAPAETTILERFDNLPVFATLDDPPISRTLTLSHKRGRQFTETERTFIEITKNAVQAAQLSSQTAFGVAYDIQKTLEEKAQKLAI